VEPCVTRLMTSSGLDSKDWMKAPSTFRTIREASFSSRGIWIPILSSGPGAVMR
jgi:hypothetical protein